MSETNPVKVAFAAAVAAVNNDPGPQNVASELDGLRQLRALFTLTQEGLVAEFAKDHPREHDRVVFRDVSVFRELGFWFPEGVPDGALVALSFAPVANATNGDAGRLSPLFFVLGGGRVHTVPARFDPPPEERARAGGILIP